MTATNLKRKVSILATLLSASLCFSAPSLANSTDLPDIGTTAGATLTIDQERNYGDAYMRILRASQPIVSDPVLSEYVSSLGYRLVANASDVKTPFKFFLIRDRNINAFAFFGGHVALHTGLFLHANTEGELASVVAHEIAHVTQRHLARRMEDQARKTPVTIAALAGSILLAIAAPEAGIAAITATQAGAMQSAINYTRSNEKEADRVGMSTLIKTGYDPHAMPHFFGRLADQYRYASKPPPMLLTHPLPEDRITDTRARADAYPSKPHAPVLDFHMAKARIVARYVGINSDGALDWLKRKEKSASAEIKPAYQYGKALVYLDTKQLDKAEALLVQLQKQLPNSNFVLDALADLNIAKKTPQKAQVLLENALKTKPGNPTLEINLANVLIEQDKNKEAIRLLQRYTHANSDDSNGWHLLSKAHANLGDSANEVAARGELYALSANWNRAIQSFTQAAQLSQLGSNQQARFDARIDQLLQQRDQFMALQN
ncbi:peptidase M48 family protein [Vibrio halioticoli NBRC 102217]|uniref:Putative beta-barrel assembly-enhancing protease n=1 Tax=Vibrio halioticoli NBRC 102217 TaxID=1219072 RepID=V5FC90_9VIBR|nr:M48 family metallopeptidase [Vibrio halioticoli]GAD89033.1 peptidase M48 family protein [Vibrio halioticoli NBRC 102217]